MALIHKFRVIFFISIIFLLALASCQGQATPIPNPETSEASIYVSKCGSCHSVPHPKRHTYEQWEHLLLLMDRRIKERHYPEITATEKFAIKKYLYENAR